MSFTHAHSCRLLQLSHIKRKQLQQADFQEMSDEYVNVLMDKYVNVLTTMIVCKIAKGQEQLEERASRINSELESVLAGM